MPKKLAVGAAAALGLRTELEKAKLESKNKDPDSTDKSGSRNQPKNKHENAWLKKNKGVEERGARDLETGGSGEKTLEQSRRALEQKSRIYGKMVRNPDAFKEIVEQSSVDFQVKSWHQVSESESDSDESKDNNQGNTWIEIVDEFGRNRVVRKSEVHNFVPPSSGDRSHYDNDSDDDYKGRLLSDDMARELERQAWEREAMASLSQSTNEFSHYDQTMDTRSKGVGYYQLSQDEDVRKQQLRELARLREETKRVRAHRKPIIEKRNRLIQKRWEKVSSWRRRASAASAKHHTV